MQHVHLVTYSVQQANEAMNAHRDFLRAAHPYPLTTFPGHREEDLLGQLMRKKLEPKVEDWIAEYSKAGRRDNSQVNGAPTEAGLTGGLKAQELRDLWSWAGPTSNGIVKGMVENGAFEDDFTLAEIEGGVENVATGLKRKLYEEDEADEEKDDEDDKMEDVIPTQSTEEQGIDPTRPPMQMERILKFMSIGTLPM